MIAHLSAEQLSECMVGQPHPVVAQHVQDCPVCRAELASFREALGDFRGAVRAWSDDQAGAYRTHGALSTPGGVTAARSWRASHQFAWALLIAAVCIIASFVIPRHEREPAPSDAVLLNQVDTEVSRTVPSSMEPLMKLVVQK